MKSRWRLCVICEDACEVVGADTKLDSRSNVTNAGWDEEFDFSNQVAVSVDDLYEGGW